MTSQEGYDLSQFMRPGCIIVMGPETSVSAPVKIRTLPYKEYEKLTGFSSWFEYDFNRHFGRRTTNREYGQWSRFCREFDRNIPFTEWLSMNQGG